MASSVAASVPPIMPVPIATRLLAPAPVAIASGVTPGDKRQRGHDNRTQTRLGGPQGGARQGVAFGDFGFGKLDNQNGVLRRQTDGGQQRHLEVDVVAQAAQGGGHAPRPAPQAGSRG